MKKQNTSTITHIEKTKQIYIYYNIDN